MMKNGIRNKRNSAKLEMTPMIDVVFQLLIFFIVTLQEQDILAHLNISRPAPPDTPSTLIDTLLTVEIGKSGWVLNGRPFMGQSSFAQLDKEISRFASFDREASVVVKCASDSEHSALIRVLNVLTREEMKNISVFSL
jgi:biopolymer transport protein ExbD